MDANNQGRLRSIKLKKPSPPPPPRPTVEEAVVVNGGATEAEAEEEEEEPLSPASRVFHTPNFNCHIIALIGSKTKINPEAVKAGLEKTFLKHPRFYSKVVVVDGEKRWVKTKVNIEDHVIIPDIDPNVDSPDQFVEDYVSDITKTSLDPSKPLWEFHLLNIKTSDAEAVAIFRLHHSIGDGASLISLLLASCRKTSDLDSFPTLPVQKRGGGASSRKASGLWSFLVTIGLMFQLVWNTIGDVLMLVATMSFLKDTDSPIKGAPDSGLTPKRFVHRTISFDDIKLVKNAMSMTINDVVLGVTQAGLAKYLNRRYGGNGKNNGAAKNRGSLPKKIRLRSAILVNIRPSVGIEALADMMNKSKFTWGNCIGYIILPFTVTLQDDPLDYIRQAKAAIDSKKLSLGSNLSHESAKLVVKVFGEKVGAVLIHKVLANTTMSYSNVVGPLEEISFHGHPLAYLAPSVYGHPHALTIHFQSYMDKMTISVTVDPSVIPDPHQLCDDLEDSLKLIKTAVLESKQ